MSRAVKGQLVRTAQAGRELAKPGAVKDRAWVDELLDDWLGTKAPTTLSAYKRDFADFAGFVSNAGKADHEGMGAALAEFLGNGEEHGNRVALAYKRDLMARVAPRTVNRRLSSLRSLVVLARVGWVVGVKGMRVTAVRDTSGVPRDAYKAMRKALRDEAKTAREENNERSLLRAMRDLAILRLWHDMGLRRASVELLDLEDVRLKRETLMVILKGKGTEKHERPCPSSTCKVLEEYLAVRGSEDGPLFFSLSNRARGKRLLSTSYNKVLIRIVELANADHANPHKFRHSAITRALDKGASIRDVAAFSGHADIRTVMIYDDRRGVVARGVGDLVAEDDDDDDDD